MGNWTRRAMLARMLQAAIACELLGPDLMTRAKNVEEVREEFFVEAGESYRVRLEYNDAIVRAELYRQDGTSVDLTVANVRSSGGFEVDLPRRKDDGCMTIRFVGQLAGPHCVVWYDFWVDANPRAIALLHPSTVRYNLAD